VATLARSIFAQPDGDSVWAQHGRIVTQLQERFPEAAKLLVEAGPDLLAFTSFPKEHWRQIWSNNPQERRNREIRRRTDVVGIFPNRAAVLRLVGAVLAEQHDEWAIARRYMTAESLAKACVTVIDGSRSSTDDAGVLIHHLRGRGPTAPTTKPCAAGNCTRPGGLACGGSCGFVEQSCCASAAQVGSRERLPRRIVGTTFVSLMASRKPACELSHLPLCPLW
jgi:hypothetical protein